MEDKSMVKDHPDTDVRPSTMTIQKWGGLASFLMVIAIITAHWFYLTGNLGDPLGPFTYTLADFLYGVVWAASLVTAVYALRERIGERAPRLMTLALLLAIAAACAFVTVASIRSANRYYHLAHPELHLESSSTVLIVWATLVSGIIGAAWHFLGWAFVLIGLSGWTSHRLPRILSALYWVAGAVSLLVYLFPGLEGTALVLALAVSVWQGILLWRTEPGETQSSATNASPYDWA
jgi:hypothetical protein